MANNQNITTAYGWQNYLPVLQGATDNPVVTYTTQLGRFYIQGAVLYFNFTIVTSTMTKTTLTDLVQVTLPLAAATLASSVAAFTARVENATPVANMSRGEIASGASVANFRNYTLAAASAQMTYAVTTPGIGVLTNAITLQGSGSYEFAGTGQLS